MTVSDQQTGIWRPLPGASAYEVCSVGGRFRSIDRDGPGGRRLRGVELTPKRTGKSRYWQVKYTDDTGRQRTRPVHQLVLEAHVGLCPEGMEGCHGDDNPDNNDLSNLRWAPPSDNDADRARNHPAPPKPPPPDKQCIRCGATYSGKRNSPRCHPCVVELGVTAATLLRDGVELDDACKRLGYPSASGLHTLARRHGGYGQPWSRRVIARWRSWLAGGDAP